MAEIYTVVFDAGKPYTETFTGHEKLRRGLMDFYFLNRDTDGFYDARVYNEDDQDITESQFITELIGEFIGDDE